MFKTITQTTNCPFHILLFGAVENKNEKTYRSYVRTGLIGGSVIE